MNKHTLPILVAALLSLGVLCLTGCQRGPEEMAGELGTQPLVEQPDANPPAVYFPRGLQADDITLNQFIEHALEVCAKGDYDQFRLLFASAYTPPMESDFERIWKGVKSIQVISVHPDMEEPPSAYYVHAVVQLREPDARQRTRRDAIVAVFKEAGEWRLSPPPKEVVHKILMIDSRPADDIATETDAHPANTSRPSSAPSV